MKQPPELPKGSPKVRVFDLKTRGFFVEFRRTGATFYFRYTDKRGRKPETKLGRYGDVTVDQARRRAEQLKADVSLGGDPAAEVAMKAAIPLYRDLLSERVLPHSRDRQRGYKNLENYGRRLCAVIGNKPLDQIAPTDVDRVRRSLLAAGLSNGTVNRHLAFFRSSLNLAKKWGLLKADNPAASPGMLPEQHRDRYLSPVQTRALVHALGEEPHRDAAAAIGLLIFTGARKSEVTRATWANVDFDRQLLTVLRSKNGRTRYIPLAQTALNLLRVQYARRRPDNPYVFPGKVEGQAIEDLRGPWKRAKVLAGLPADLRLHDLRHSFASALANAGTPLNEIGVILGHRELSTTQRYAHHAPQRLVDTATVASRAWDLLPAPQVSANPH